jgi:hypothetical protein
MTEFELKEHIAFELAKCNVGKKVSELLRLVPTNESKLREVIKSMVAAHHLEKTGASASQTRYNLTQMGRLMFVSGSDSALEQNQKQSVKTPDPAPTATESPLMQNENEAEMKSNTTERIDEIESKPYPFVTDGVVEGFETRINPNQRIAMTDFESPITHHTPINEKTVNEIRRHLNGSTSPATPDYYKGKTMQVFDVLDDFLTPEAVNGFYAGNVIKYVTRYKGKDGRADLIKARDYLDRLIEATK